MPIYGDESAALFGDDIDFRSRAVQVDLAGFPTMMFMLRRAGAGTSPVNRVAQATRLMAGGGRAVVEQMANHCSAAGVFADRLGLDAEVRAGIEQAYTRWDGKGVPAHLEGDAVSLATRVSHVAEACEVVHRVSGLDQAVDMVQARSGTHFDPAIAAAVCTDPESLFDGIDVDAADTFLDHEPVPRAALTDDELDAVLLTIGDFGDLRSPSFAGHCRGTASLVAAAAESLALGPDEARLVYRAALVHDLGRFGVPGSVWSKPGPLTASDQERMRLHVYYVERIFQRPEPLRRVGLLAATHHERMDGSGYHPGSVDRCSRRPHACWPRPTPTTRCCSRVRTVLRARRTTRPASCGPRSTPVGSTATRSTPCSPPPVTPSGARVRAPAPPV